jgi:dipeptidyl aminopeptidase/acylaminoacyl peptidase
MPAGHHAPVSLVHLLVALAVVPLASAFAQNDVPLIPRQVLFGNPDRAGVQLSPDGKWLSYRAAVDGVMNVWVAPREDLSKARAVTQDKHRGITFYFWAYTNNHILYLKDKDGDENWHIHCVDLTSGEDRDLTDLPGVQARVQEVSPDFPNEILIGLNNRDPQMHDIYRLNLTTGERSLVEENRQGYVGYLSDRDMKLYFAVQSTPDGGMDIFRSTAPGNWTSFTRIPHGDTLTTQALGLDKSRKNLYMMDSRERNTSALTLVAIESGEAKVLAEDPKADIEGLITHPTERHVQAVNSNYTRRNWKILDPAIQGDFDVLAKVARGEFDVTSRTLDDSQWIVAYDTDAGPVQYYHYDRLTKKPTFLFTNRKALEKLPLARMNPVVVPASDGLGLVSYYTLPVQSDPDNDGKPAGPLPMVLFVHGGPWARDYWGYDPYHQWLANRGYAVLSVNFRGSTGLGKAFVNAGDHEWAGKMHQDLIDAVDWAVKEGIADPQRVGIMGGSYGGYATLVGLTFTPDKFACGVDIVGPSNLITLLSTIPPYWAPMIEIFTQRVGDHRTEEGRKLLTERSPLSRVDQIKRPLLIGQGANDPRVKQAESDQIVAAMKNHKIPVTYALFPDEGHGFARPENGMAFNAVAEVFLSRHLGGRHEAISEDIRQSSLTVPAGGGDIQGLMESLQKKEPESPAQ